jgi:hypothetical protein
MKRPNYKEQLDAIIRRISAIVREKSDLEAEAVKLKQLVHATANMLPDKERDEVLTKWGTILQVEVNHETSLTEAIRRVLQRHNEQWLTTAKVRDLLVSSGFDFSGYVSNPLASVSTTLRRLPPQEVEAAEIDGVAAYRWSGKKETWISRAQTMGSLKDMK